MWHPVLTDMHLQVVHALSPVLVEPHQRLGDSSPTLSLSLLPASNTAAQLQAEQELQHIPDSLTLPVKPAL